MHCVSTGRDCTGRRLDQARWLAPPLENQLVSQSRGVSQQLEVGARPARSAQPRGSGSEARAARAAPRAPLSGRLRDVPWLQTPTEYSRAGALRCLAVILIFIWNKWRSVGNNYLKVWVNGWWYLMPVWDVVWQAADGIDRRCAVGLPRYKRKQGLLHGGVPSLGSGLPSVTASCHVASSPCCSAAWRRRPSPAPCCPWP